MTDSDVSIYAIVTKPAGFSRRSGLFPLTESLGARPCLYRKWWPRVLRVSWRAGHILRVWGQRWYHSEWNALVPILHDVWLRQVIPGGRSIAHFLFAEFAAPRNAAPLRRRGAIVVGTFHASVRRQEQVHGSYPLENFDWITVVSKSQLSFFTSRGYPEERLRVTYHGVDTDYFRPLPERVPSSDKRLHLLLVGSTERDHPFMASVCRKLPAKDFEVTILTSKGQHGQYAGIDSVRMPGHLADEGLLRAYQKADILVMPMLDCTANNAILEAMACGTPVMANRVGGIPEYVSEECNFLIEDKNVDDWVARLDAIRCDPGSLESLRPRVRSWAERFAWPVVAESFREVYSEALTND